MLGIVFGVIACPVRAQTYWPTSQPPVATSSSFPSWARQYVENAVSSCPLDRPTTYYFSQAGSDTTGDGTQGNPWKSIAKANEVLQGSSGDLRLRFRAGEIWREPDGLVVDRPHVTVDSYSASGDPLSAKKPLFSRFEPPVPSHAWVPVGPGTYSVSTSADVAWVKYWNDDETVFRRMENLDDCLATAGSWHWESGQLYVHNFTDQDLSASDLRIEYVLKNQGTGIWIKDVPDVRIMGLHVEGFGAGTPGDESYTGYAIESDVTGSGRTVVSECDTFYSGRHSITKIGQGQGGSLVVVRCRMGWLVNDNIDVVSYTSLGGQELVSAYNQFLGAQLPNTNKPYPYAGSGGPHYMHTSNNAQYKGAFSLCLGNRIEPGPYMCGAISATDCSPTFQNLSDCRSFVVDEWAPSRAPSALDATKPSSNGGNGLLYSVLGSPGVVYVNCTVEPTVLWTSYVGDTYCCNQSSGVWINSNITFDFRPVDSSQYLRLLTVTSAQADFSQFTSSFYGCRLWFKGKGGGYMGFSGQMLHIGGAFYGSIGARWLGELRGCIVGATGVGSGFFRLGWGNDGTTLFGNSYFGLDTEGGAWGCDLDASRLPGTTATGPPMASSGLGLPGPILVWGQPLQYDCLGRMRQPHPTVGPYEADLKMAGSKRPGG